MTCPKCKREIWMKSGLSKPIAAALGPIINLKKTVEKEALINAET